MAEASRWRWIRTNPQTGQLRDLSYARYRPPKILKEFVRGAGPHLHLPRLHPPRQVVRRRPVPPRGAVSSGWRWETFVAPLS